MTASEPPELPEPEIEYRRPAWVEPPADVVPGIVPVELVLARILQRAMDRPASGPIQSGSPAPSVKTQRSLAAKPDDHLLCRPGPARRAPLVHL